MRLLRRPKAKSSRRQSGFTTANERPAKNSTYHSKRIDQEANIGRQISRKQTNKSDQNYMQFWLQRSGLAVLLIVSIVSVIYALNLSSNARIIFLKSSGSSFVHDQATYQTAADTILSKSIWNHNKLTVNTTDISRQMLNQFSELSSVNIVLPLLAHRPVIYLTPSQPSLIIIGANGTFLLDTNGKALLAITDIISIAGLKLPILTDQSGLKLAINHRALSSSDIAFIQIVIAQLAAKQVVITGLTLPVASREIDAGIAGKSYFVKFNLQNGNALLQSGTFLATQSHLSSKNITPAHYIDVRVPGRAYYQ